MASWIQDGIMSGSSSHLAEKSTASQSTITCKGDTGESFTTNWRSSWTRRYSRSFLWNSRNKRATRELIKSYQAISFLISYLICTYIARRIYCSLQISGILHWGESYPKSWVSLSQIFKKILGVKKLKKLKYLLKSFPYS